MEKISGEDETDDRTKRMKERFDYDLIQQVAEGYERVESAPGRERVQGRVRVWSDQRILSWVS